MALLLALLSYAAAVSAGEEGGACPASVQSDTCLVTGGATFIGPPQNLTMNGCCAACAASAASDPEAGCTAFQWNYQGNSWGDQNFTRGAECHDKSVNCCFLFAGHTRVKAPVVHRAQSQCTTGQMPLPPAPPWPATPPAGAKNILYVLVDDLRTQMTVYGHVEMKTPHFSAFAETVMHAPLGYS
jgi:hypothetical protein